MKATLLRAYACAPEGHTVIKFMAGETVEGIVAQMALSDGAAVEAQALPVLETKIETPEETKIISPEEVKKPRGRPRKA